MAGYAKIFESILVSTVWQLSKEARVLWITMLVLKDREQMVRASLPGLAHTARLTLEETKSALKELEKPDPYSQSKDEGGSRIKTLAGSCWFIVNGEKYQDMLNLERRREDQARWMKEMRAAKKAGKILAKRVGVVDTYAERLQTKCEHGGEWMEGATAGTERCSKCGYEREKVEEREQVVPEVQQ